MPLPVGFQSDVEGWYIYKDKDATKRYTVDWSKWLAGDTIASVIWEVTNGLTEGNKTNDDITASILLGGGVINTAYGVVCRINTIAGQIEDQPFRVVIPDAS